MCDKLSHSLKYSDVIGMMWLKRREWHKGKWQATWTCARCINTLRACANVTGQVFACLAFASNKQNVDLNAKMYQKLSDCAKVCHTPEPLHCNTRYTMYQSYTASIATLCNKVLSKGETLYSWYLGLFHQSTSRNKDSFGLVLLIRDFIGLGKHAVYCCGRADWKLVGYRVGIKLEFSFNI